MGRQSHGHDPTVVHSSIALLQERFRQLQRAKEMREERQLLRMLTSEPKQLISNPKSSMTPTNFEPPPTPPPPPFSYPELTIIPSTTRKPPSPPPPPPTQSRVSLSLWPSSTTQQHEPLPPRETLSSAAAAAATFLEPCYYEIPDPTSMTLRKKNAYDCCDGSDSDSDSGVDTSLHL